MRTGWMLLAIAAAVLVCQSTDAHRDHGSWKQTLAAKADQIEKIASARHNILGSYPSSVRLQPPDYYAGDGVDDWKTLVETGDLPPGWYVDHGTTGISNIAHTSSWTGCLLTGAAFRVASLRKEFGEDSAEYKQAYERANEIIHSLRILTLVSGQPGFLARGMALGHGISYEERGMSDTRDLWQQGQGEYSYLRYRGGPSHHNYDQVFRGLGIYYFVAADDAQKEAIRAIVTDMSNWAHLKNNLVVMHADGKHESTVLIGGWRGLDGADGPSGGSLMATTGMKIASMITGNERVKALYEKWADRLGYRDAQKTAASIMGPSRGNYDDTDHLLGDLYLLNLIEKDPALLAFYRKCVKDSWEAHKDEKISWFNFVYRAVLGDEYGDVEGSIWNLQTFPTCRIFQPQMNSIRTDLEFTDRNGEKEALHPLPVYQRPSDNEYEWKASPFKLDGWLSRIASVLEVSPHDLYVQLAADTSGSAYWSNTKGEIWHAVEGVGSVQDFLFSPDYPWIVLAGGRSGITRSMDGGKSWSNVYSAVVSRFTIDPDNTHVIYAAGPDGIYKSPDFGERAVGGTWENLTGAAPSGTRLFAVDPRGEAARLYLLTRDHFFTKREKDESWSTPERLQRMHGFGEVDAIGGTPLWLTVDDTRPDRLFRAVQISEGRMSAPLISVSEDGGQSWSPIVRDLLPLVQWADSTKPPTTLTETELRRTFGLMRKYPIQDLRVDRKDPNTWYGRQDDGVLVTHDAGKTWTAHHEGLDIPRVQALFTARHSGDLYVGTPAGMYVSHDQGEHWEDTSLILQGEGAIRSEIGGNAYLTAYWLGRYHNFITADESQRRWWEN